MKQQKVATHQNREAKYHQIAQKMTIHQVFTFCSVETGGLDAMLLCEVKKLIHRELGCTTWKV